MTTLTLEDGTLLVLDRISALTPAHDNLPACVYFAGGYLPVTDMDYHLIGSNLLSWDEHCASIEVHAPVTIQGVVDQRVMRQIVEHIKQAVPRAAPYIPDGN